MKHYLLCCALAALALAACGQNDNSAQSTAPSMKFEIPPEAKEISVDAIKGDWMVGAKVARVKAEEGKLVCINEKGEPSKCEIRDGKVLFATDWRVYATLIADGKVLRWSDGSGWTR